MTPEAEATPEAEPLGNGEPVAFQTPDGTTVEGVLLTAPGPNQRIVIFAAPDVGRYRAVYSGLVRSGLAVLAFSAGEDAGAPVETAVRLARSREYPLVFVVTADAAGANAPEFGAGLEVEGLIVSDALSRQVDFYRNGEELEEHATLKDTSMEAPEQLREVILRYVGMGE